MNDGIISASTGVEYVRRFFAGEPWDVDGLLDIIFYNDTDSFEIECQEWIASFASIQTDFERIKCCCISLLEQSDFLNFYDSDVSQRHHYEERLTLVAELLGFYEHAKRLTLIDEEDGDGLHGSAAYINDLFSKLKRSGFVYHPRKHINILMSLFVLKPELMEQSIEEMFAIIFNRQIEIWKQYPFRTVMIQALERYIQTVDDRITTMTANSSAIDNTMRALVVQLTLGEEKDDGIFDRNLSFARLFRYASYKAMSKSVDMFSRAYEFILGTARFGMPMYSLYRSKAVDLIASYLNSEMAGASRSSEDKRWQYENNNVRLTIANGKIMLMPSETSDDTRSVLPDGLLDWNAVDILVNDRVDIPKAEVTDILPYKIMWRDIESLLFSAHAKTEPLKHTRQYLAEGDETMITIDSAVDQENDCFCCTILDKNIRGEAYIDLSDIVSYINHTFARNFCDAYGHKLKFLAKVDSVDDDGTYHMSMKDGIDEMIKDTLSEGAYLSCSVGDSYVADFGIQRGISYEGYPMTVHVDSKLDKNTRLTAEYIGYDDEYHALRLDFVDLEPAQKVFTPSEAFQRLMSAYSQYCVAQQYAMQRAIEARQEQKIPVMQRSHVVELMLMIDRIAIIQQDYLTSYNYLALARLLARLIGMEDRRSFYNGRMDLIELLNYFAINNEVDQERFAELEAANGNMFTQNVILRKRFNQVRIVSWLGHQEHNLELRQQWEDAGEDEVISDISGLALSYNILTQAGLLTQAADVHSQIKSMLNLKGHESTMKNYGSMEDDTCEFKTSIVYLPGTANKFDPDAQMDNILKVVDEMLNTRGGIIYLGVNRYGQGVGLQNDLDNVLFHNDKEEYIRFIYKYISKKISPHAANALVQIDFDRENTRQDICLIKVSQSPQGFPFNGEYCVRRGDSVYRYDKEGYEEYRKIRDSIYASDRERQQTMQAEGLEAVSVLETTEVADMAGKMSNWDSVQASTFIEYISTSQRKAMQHNDMPPHRYLCFMGHGVFQFTDHPLGNIPLSLPIYDHDQYVVVVYSDGTAHYTTADTLMEYELNVEYRGTTNQRVTYASTACEGESLLLVVNTKGGGVMRVQDIDRMQRGDLLSSGKALVTGETITVENIEIVTEEERGVFKKCHNTDCELDSKHGRKNMEKFVEFITGDVL